MKNGRADKRSPNGAHSDTAGADAIQIAKNKDLPEKPPAKQKSLKGLWNLRQYMLQYKLMLSLAGVGLALAAGAALILPLAVRRVIDFGFSPENAGLINSYFLVLLLVAGVLAGASALRFYCVSWLGERAVTDIRTPVLDRKSVV